MFIADCTVAGGFCPAAYTDRVSWKMSPHSKIRKRVLSGRRPTGKLHLGNFVGALQNWVGMQDLYECYFCVLDWHALTTDYADTSKVKENSIEVLLDWLGPGLDPDRSNPFIRADISLAAG